MQMRALSTLCHAWGMGLCGMDQKVESLDAFAEVDLIVADLSQSGSGELEREKIPPKLEGGRLSAGIAPCSPWADVSDNKGVVAF